MGLFYCPLWAPEKILTDQGCNFESDLLKELCEIAQLSQLGHWDTIPRQMDSVNVLM